MTLQEAIKVRHSVRQYKDTVIEAEKMLIGSYVHTDLGIVKYHFEVAAGKENFEWINCSID